MGLFGFGKPKDPLATWLKNADDVYIRAYETRDIVLLKDWFSRDCCMKLSRVIAATASTRLFVAESFRNTTWECLSKNDSSAVYLKSVKHDGVKIASYKMAIGGDYEETWYIDIIGKNSFMVTNIDQKESEGNW